jgi:uncharacterized membrane protein YebE (DUF533 family)
MLDARKLLDDLLGSKVPGTESTVREKADQVTQLAKDNPLATGAVLAVLLGTGTGRELTGSALKLGGLAAIAGLGYKAFKSYQNGDKPAEAAARERDVLPAPKETSFHPSHAPQGEQEFALTLVRAMIAAAKSDGHVDDDERRKIADKLSLAGIGAEARKFLDEELKRPSDLDQLVAAAKTDAQKIELYTASRLAVDPDTRAERGYLDLLAGRLGLPDALVAHVEATVSEAAT